MEGTLTNIIFKELKDYSTKTGTTYKHYLFFKFKEFSIPCRFLPFREGNPRNNFMDPEAFPKKYAIKDKILGEKNFGQKFKFHIYARNYDELINGSLNPKAFKCLTLINENEDFYSYKDLMDHNKKVSVWCLWGSFLSICYSLFWFFLGHYFLLKEPKKNS